MGPYQAELKEFIRRLKVAEDRERSAARAIAALRQGVRDAWTEGGGGCVTTITGAVQSPCVSPPTNLPGSSVRVVGTVTGTDYGTFAAADGTYKAVFRLNPADTSVDVYAIGPAPWFAAGTPATPSVAPCQSYGPYDYQATPASGYSCTVNSFCQNPVAHTLNVVDTQYGSYTATWNATDRRWEWPATITTQTGGGCTPVTTSVLFWFSYPGGTSTTSSTYVLGIDYYESGSCPTTGTGAYNATEVLSQWNTPTITCSNASGGKFSYSLNLATSNFPQFYSGTQSITLSEP